MDSALKGRAEDVLAASCTEFWMASARCMPGDEGGMRMLAVLQLQSLAFASDVSRRGT